MMIQLGRAKTWQRVRWLGKQESGASTHHAGERGLYRFGGKKSSLHLFIDMYGAITMKAIT